MLPSLYALPFYDFYLRASHARTILPAALASVPFAIWVCIADSSSSSSTKCITLEGF